MLLICYRSCTIVEDVLIGEETSISDNTTVSKSIIGRNCCIGKNVTISNSHLLNNVTVKDNCNIINSFVDENCIIEENSNLEGGTIVAANVTVKSGSELKGILIESSVASDGNGMKFV